MTERTRQIIAIIMAAMIIFSFASCENRGSTADMRITLEKEISRTITPGDVTLSITNYDITCTGPNNESYKLNTKRNTFVLEDVPVGSWSIKADGKNEEGIVLVTGSTTFNLNETNTSATVSLTEMVGSGNLSLVYTWDSTLVRQPRLVIQFTGMDNSVTKEYTPTVTSGSSTLSVTSQTSGSYTVNAKLYDDGLLVAGAIDAVRIVSGKTTTGTISLDLDQAPPVVGQLTLENRVGTPVVCVVSGLENNSTIAAQTDCTVSLDTQSINIEDVTIDWYLDGNKIKTGPSVTIKPDPGKHRLDIIARTAMMGSTGSTQVNFEAALLGAVGEPVVAGLISNGDIKIGSRTNIEFLPDGKVLVISDAGNVATVCSIKKNTLIAEASQTLTKPTQLLKAIPGSTNTVVTVSDSDRSVTRWVYDKNTCSLINPVSCAGQVYGRIENPKFDSIEAIVNPSTWTNGYFAVVGQTGDNTTISMRHLTNTNTTPGTGSDVYMANGKYLNYNKGYKYTLIASNTEGDVIAAVDTVNGGLVVNRGIDGTSKTKPFEDAEAIGATAIAVLESPDSTSARFVIAVGDTLKVYRGSVEGSFVKAAEVSRTEGTGLNTTYMFTSADGHFLYTLNAGNKTISAYSVNGDTLTYIGREELGFTPYRAVIANSGSYIFVSGVNHDKIMMLKVRTSI
ncbi:MAG: hypothetical protein ACI4NM_10850 [Bullifex sp.]